MKRFILTVSAMLAMAFSCFAANPESDFIYDLAPDGQGVMIKEYKGKSTTVVIPDTIEGLPVTQIGTTGLGFGVFPHTRNKATKDIPYNITVPKSVKVIGDGAFSGVKGKINIDLSNITAIYSNAFSYSDLSGTIKISKNLEFKPNKAPFINEEFCCKAFANTKITAVVIEEGVTSLNADQLFWECSELKSVTLPASLTHINNNVFSLCSALTEVIIPEGTKINYSEIWVGNPTAFSGCTSLSLATRAKIKATGYTGEF